MAMSNLMLRLMYAAAMLALVVAGLSGLLANSSEGALYAAVGALLASAAISLVLLILGCGTGVRTLLAGGSVMAHAAGACVAALLAASATFVPRPLSGLWAVPAIFAFSGALVVIGIAASDGVGRDLSDHVLYSLIAMANAVLAGSYVAFMPVVSTAALTAGGIIAGCLAAAAALPLLGSKLAARVAAPGGA
jgi:hypothetical protein